MEKCKEEGRDIRKEVTGRWVDAVDYLIEMDFVRSYRKFSEALGIDYQRINIFKSFINNGGRASYANTDHIVLINEKFKVSFDFLLKGVGDVLENKDQQSIISQKEIKPDDKSNRDETDLLIRRVQNNEDKIDILERRMQMVERMIKY